MSEISNNIASPDPAWDYYPLWHSLQHIKAKIDAALKVMNESEYSSSDVDQEIRDFLEPASDQLIDIIDHDLVIDDENE